MQDSIERPYDLVMLCRAKRISLTEVGRRMRPLVPRSTIARWADGSRTLTPDRAAEIAMILGEDVSVIWKCVEAAKAFRTHNHNPLSHPPPDSGTPQRAAPPTDDPTVA